MDGLFRVLDSRIRFGFDLLQKSFDDVVPIPPPGSSYILTEAGDFLTTETGNRLVTE